MKSKLNADPVRLLRGKYSPEARANNLAAILMSSEIKVRDATASCSLPTSLRGHEIRVNQQHAFESHDEEAASSSGLAAR